MKTKVIALLEISVVLCSVFLVALPVIAADQNQTTQEVSASEVTTASEDDYVLGIYGNANEDDTIDMRDLTYVKLIFFGKKPETELADAKYDGKINPLDFIQIKLIIVGKEKEITIVDSADRTVTIYKPVESVVAFVNTQVETLRAIKTADKIVGVDGYTTKRKTFFPEFSDCPCVGSVRSPDIEKVLELQPDVVFVHDYSYYQSYIDDIENKIKEANPSIAVLCFDCYTITLYVEEVKKLGYIFDKRDEADEFIEFYKDCMDGIKENVEGLSEEDKPKVYFEVYRDYYTYGGPGSGGFSDLIPLSGANNIFSDLVGWVEVDPEEVVMRNPEIIVRNEYSVGGYDLNVESTAELEILREEIMNRPELQKVTAVVDGGVYILGGPLYSARKNCVFLGYLAKWFHPDLFKDLDPKAMHQEYLTRFQGLDIDLDKKGVFVYPEPS